MADELRINASLEYRPTSGRSRHLQILDLLADMATLKFVEHEQSIGTSEEAIVLGEVTSPGWAMFLNADSTNFINLKVATSGAIFAKLLPGEIALLRLGSGAQAPYAIADTAACKLEYLIALT